MKKVRDIDNRTSNLEEKIELFSENIYAFPKDLGLMSCILLYTGVDKGKMFYLKDTDFYYEKEDSWMRIPGENRSIPIPEGLHLRVLRFLEVKKISVDSYMFLNHNKKHYTYESFQNAIMKQCKMRNILQGEYVFKGNGYQIELCKELYKRGVPIQSIREYMGYASDETVKRNLGLMEQKVIDASKMFYEKNGSILRGLSVAKYDKMREKNKEENQKKIELAIDEVREIASKGEKVSVSEVFEHTGLSKAFFYKNEQVRSVLDEVNEKYKMERFVAIKEEVKNKSLERQVAYYEKQLREVIAENASLKAENEKLKEMHKKYKMTSF